MGFRWYIITRKPVAHMIEDYLGDALFFLYYGVGPIILYGVLPLILVISIVGYLKELKNSKPLRKEPLCSIEGDTINRVEEENVSSSHPVNNISGQLINFIGILVSIGFLLFVVGDFKERHWKEDVYPSVVMSRFRLISYAMGSCFHSEGRFPENLKDLGEYESPIMDTGDPYNDEGGDFLYNRIEGTTEEKFELYFTCLEAPALIGYATKATRAWKCMTTPEFEVFLHRGLSETQPQGRIICQWPEIDEKK